MKSISALFIMTFIVSTSFSQSGQVVAALANKTYTDPHTTGGSAHVKPDYSFYHSLLAVEQITQHLRTNTEYPTTMVDNAIEGMVVAKVWISERGKIKKAEILKSPNKIFDQFVLSTLQSFTEIEFQQPRYEGKQVVFVPIRFSLN